MKLQRGLGIFSQPGTGTGGKMFGGWRNWLSCMGLVLLGLGVLMLVGCGGEKKPKSPPPPVMPPGPETPPLAGPETPPPGTEVAPGQQAGAASTEKKPEEKPKRPEKVEDWRRDDYFSAKREGDPRLVEALRYFGQRFAADKKAADAALMLEELIQVETLPVGKPEEKPAAGGTPGTGPGIPPAPSPGMMPPGAGPGMPPPETLPPQGPGYMPGGTPGMGPTAQPQRFQLSQEALQIAIWALVINQSPESRQILGKILSGQIDTGMDRLATETVLKLLAIQGNPETEQLLLAALIAPDKLRPPKAKEKASGPGVGPGMPPAGPAVPPGGPGYGPGYSPAYGMAGEQVTPEWLQQVSLDLAKNYGSATLREKLAQYLMDPKIPLAVVERLGAFLWEPHPANLRAQLVLLQAPDTTEERRRKLLEYFMKYSADSLALVLGVPAGAVSAGPGMWAGGGPGFGPGWGMEGPGGIPGIGPSLPGPMPGQVPGEFVPGAPGGLPPGGGPGGIPGLPGTGPPQPDPDLPYRTAATVWGPDIQTYLAAALAKINSLEEQAAVLVWAATVPIGEIRYQTYEVLKARWYDGPAGLQKAGFPNQWVCDPALLVCLKQLPRAKGFRSGSMPGMGSPGIGIPGGTPGIGTPGVGPGGKPLPPAVREKLLKEQTEEDWLRMSGDLVLALCQRFQQAGLQEIERARLQRRRPDFKKPIADLPLELHEPDLTPKPSYRAALPGEAGKKISGVSLAPTLIHYVRLEQKEKPSKVLSAYKKQLKNVKTYESPQMVWLDSLQPGRSEGLLRSIDVIILRGQAGPGVSGPGVGIPGGTPSRGPAAKDKEVEEPLVIQILVIEMQDPTRNPNQPPQAAQTPKEKT
ncbi:MAG: hypothetical protein NZ602_02310 [Thermoguttaceae bacterium]|nr:hypothetical protein [Thermoguttaceae bacterium]MDW8036623.1 hypothetical protein [Thermoguttaceae bacterium]